MSTIHRIQTNSHLCPHQVGFLDIKRPGLASGSEYRKGIFGPRKDIISLTRASDSILEQVFRIPAVVIIILLQQYSSHHFVLLRIIMRTYFYYVAGVYDRTPQNRRLHFLKRAVSSIEMKYIFALLFIVTLLGITTVSGEIDKFCKINGGIHNATKAKECCKTPTITESEGYPKYDATSTKCIVKSEFQMGQFCTCCQDEMCEESPP
jgi:hypothetical protein